MIPLLFAVQLNSILSMTPAALPPADQTCFADENRPDPAYYDGRLLSGPEETIPSADGFFLIHYTTEGEDTAVNLTDEDRNTIPDFADRIFAGLELGRSEFHAQGYRDLIADNSEGGSQAIDIYVKSIGANGYADAVPAADLGQGWSCYLRLNNTLGDDPGNLLESVTVHELHHCIQFRYTIDAPAWLYESTATYEQYRHVTSEVLEAASDALWYFRLSEPDRPLADLVGRWEYAGFIFIKFWEELGQGATRRIPDLWESLAIDPNWRRGLDNESRRTFGQGLNKTFLDFAEWQLFACARDDGQHFRPDNVPCRSKDGSVPVTELNNDDPSFVFAHDWVSHTAEFYQLSADGDERPAALICDAPELEGSLSLRLLITDSAGQIQDSVDGVAQDGQGIELRTWDPVDPTGQFLIVAAATGFAPPNVHCHLERVNVIGLLGGTGCDVTTTKTQGNRIVASWMILFMVVFLSRRTKHPPGNSKKLS